MNIYLNKEIKDLNRLTYPWISEDHTIIEIKTLLKDTDEEKEALVMKMASLLFDTRGYHLKVIPKRRDSMDTFIWGYTVTILNIPIVTVTKEGNGENWLEISLDTKLFCQLFSDSIDITVIKKYSNQEPPEILFHNDKAASLFSKHLWNKEEILKKVDSVRVLRPVEGRMGLIINYREFENSSGLCKPLHKHIGGLIKQEASPTERLTDEYCSIWARSNSYLDREVYISAINYKTKGTLMTKIEFPITKESEELLTGLNWEFLNSLKLE